MRLQKNNLKKIKSQAPQSGAFWVGAKCAKNFFIYPLKIYIKALLYFPVIIKVFLMETIDSIKNNGF